MINHFSISNFLVFIFLAHGELCLGQSSYIQAPPDLIISEHFNFEISNLFDPQNATFGRLMPDTSSINTVVTNDVVCENFCIPNPLTKYPGYSDTMINPNLTSAVACDNFTKFYDPNNPTKVNPQVWGLDGYIYQCNYTTLQIQVKDQRISNEGIILRIFSVIDSSGMFLSDTQTIWVVRCDCRYESEPKCNTDISLSLDANGQQSIAFEDILLASGQLPCEDHFILETRDWITNQLIDRNQSLEGTQLDCRDVSRFISVKITNMFSGKTCSSRVTVADTLPPILKCPADITINCFESTNPSTTGQALASDNCGILSLTFLDMHETGSCELGYERIITRKWLAKDLSKLETRCSQVITVVKPSIFSLQLPRNHDGIELPTLSCSDKIDPNSNILNHLIQYPECVGGFLLDSNYWRQQSNEADVYPNRRIPRILGWNAIQDSLSSSYGLPSPDDIYYPAHPEHKTNDRYCWGENQHVFLKGTGRPEGAGCRAIAMTFKDSIITLQNAGCLKKNAGCYEILRKWWIIDWCNSDFIEYIQKIIVRDEQIPEVLFPDTILIKSNQANCLANLDVPKPWLVDNCSDEISYKIISPVGKIEGNSTDGYSIKEIPQGTHEISLEATDCCSNKTFKNITIIVLDNEPPAVVCKLRVTISVGIDQKAGHNFAQILAQDLNLNSTDDCSNKLYFKTIQVAQLQGQGSGTNESQGDSSEYCVLINGDDNPLLQGIQIYFDDGLKFCCRDVGNSVNVVLRVFDVDPGPGPINPSLMSAGAYLFGHYSDCLVEVVIQDKTVPTLVGPSDIVVSCAFPIDMEKLKDPKDATFGRVVTELTLRDKLTTQDIVCSQACLPNPKTGYPGPTVPNPPSQVSAPSRACDYFNGLYDARKPFQTYEMVWGFEGYVLSACDAPLKLEVKDFRICNEGKITRKFTAFGSNNVTATTTQTIWVVSCGVPFTVNENNACDSLDDLIWPGHCNGDFSILSNCIAGILPENPNLGKPEIAEHAKSKCAVLRMNYQDRYVTNSNEPCLEIERIWTVVDSCQYLQGNDPTAGIWKYTQYIKTHDDNPPVLRLIIGKQDNIDSNGYYYIDLTCMPGDSCSPSDQIITGYQIDEFNDGIGKYPGAYDFKVGDLTLLEYFAGKLPIISDNPRAFNNANPFNASGRYPVGTHKISYFIEDLCGNKTVFTDTFVIRKITNTSDPQKFSDYYLYPNPTQGKLNFYSIHTINMVRIYSPFKPLTEFRKQKNIESIDLSVLENGIYYLEAFSGSISLGTQKIVLIKP